MMLTYKELRNIKRVCAVCGETSKKQVKYLFYRESDGKLFNVCRQCRDAGVPCGDAASLNPDIPNVVWEHPYNEHPNYHAPDRWELHVNGAKSRYPGFVSRPDCEYTPEYREAMNAHGDVSRARKHAIDPERYDINGNFIEVPKRRRLNLYDAYLRYGSPRLNRRHG